ncbi:MAG: S9 family peptidase [Gemmatimonadetes bacterium]|nr:S9 family peptidase [Gemmatimonadota bacterium]
MRCHSGSNRVKSAVTSGVVTLLAFTLLAPTQGSAQDTQWDARAVLATKEFVSPRATIAEAALAPRYLNVTLSSVSPDKLWFFNEIGDGPVTMDRFSHPFHELGGLFIDFRANRTRNLSIRNNASLEVISAADGARVQIETPRDSRVSNALWSPNGSRLAFYVHTDDATHIYVADPENGRSRRITRRPVLATMVTTFEWTADGEKIATVLVPENRNPMPLPPVVPTGPQVKHTLEGDNLLRTFASLMATPHDEALLEWHAMGQLALIDVDNRRVDEIGEPAMIRSFDFSPTGEYARVTRVVKPFSYIVPVNNFTRVEEIWDRAGATLAQVDETEMNLGIRDPDQPRPGPGQFGQDGDQDGRRQLAWRPDGQGLTYLEQEPAPEGEDDEDQTARRSRRRGGAGEDRSRRQDRVMQWLPPFDSTSTTVVYSTDDRMSAHRFSPDMNVLFIRERQGTDVREYAVFLDDPETTYTLTEHDTDDFYANPGSLVMTGGAVAGSGRSRGRRRRGGGGGSEATVQLSADGEYVFFAGTQYDEDPLEQAPKSFLDRIEIRTGETERIYESDNSNRWERITSILDIDAERFVVSRESSTDVAQSFLLENGQLAQLTANVDYTPDITAAPRERFVVERPDGFKFRVNVTLPPGYRGGERLPAMFWFYPREYEDQESYDEGARTYNKNAFPNLGTRSIEYLVRLGYAVVEPDAPIVGEAGKMNNNYEHDLRNNLAAVIDELDGRGIIDRSRLGLGGHSYGAFSTVNAMVHTPFFKAGIAGDGNYNRTLTPLTFQSERRIFWDAKDVYISMSPFMHANEMTGALLMYHGLHDQNVGTSPIHSPRLFHALNGLGKEAVMYLYPFEDHGPATKETILDLWARWTAWLDVHLMDAGQQEPKITTDAGTGSK